VATEPLATAALKKTEVYLKIENLKLDILEHSKAAIQASQNSRRAKTPQEKKPFDDEYQFRRGKIKEVEELLKPLALEIAAKKKELILAHAVYFKIAARPDRSEEIITPERADEIQAAMIAATSAGELVDKDLKRVADNRGKVFWKKSGGAWIKQEIAKLGEKPMSGATLAADLTTAQQQEIASQIEMERVQALKPAEKATEKEAILKGLVSMAAQKKTEMEITGESQALKKAQDWYNAEAAKVEQKYA